LPRFLLATLLAALSWLLARLLLSAAALLAALLAALILLAWLLFIRIHNCSFVSSLPTTKPRPLSFLRRLVRKRTIRPVESGGVHAAGTLWNVAPRPPGQSALMPVNLITFAHFSVSSAMSLPKYAGRARQHRAAQVDKPCLQLRVGETCVNLLVEPVDDLGGRALGAPTPYHWLAS